MSVAAIAAALSAACSFAVAAILQQEAAQAADPGAALHLRLLLELLRRPRWVAGVAVLVAGFSLQGVALANGPVALVQPIVATELAFAIPIAIWRRRRRAGRREWAGIASVLCGVSVFLVVASPAPGVAEADVSDWLLTVVPAGSAVLAAVLAARVRRGPRRATLLGVAAGVSFALLAVLTKAVAHQLGHGAGAAFTSWELYVLVGLGVAALVISQSAYQAGPLALSMPAIAIVEPVVAVAIGNVLFEEQARLGGAALALEVGAALVALVGLALLSTSPVVLSIYEEARPTGNRSGPVAATAGLRGRRPQRAPGGSPQGRPPRRGRRSVPRAVRPTATPPAGADRGRDPDAGVGPDR